MIKKLIFALIGVFVANAVAFGAPLPLPQNTALRNLEFSVDVMESVSEAFFPNIIKDYKEQTKKVIYRDENGELSYGDFTFGGKINAVYGYLLIRASDDTKPLSEGECGGCISATDIVEACRIGLGIGQNVKDETGLPKCMEFAKALQDAQGLEGDFGFDMYCPSATELTDGIDKYYKKVDGYLVDKKDGTPINGLRSITNTDKVGWDCSSTQIDKGKIVLKKRYGTLYTCTCKAFACKDGYEFRGGACVTPVDPNQECSEFSTEITGGGVNIPTDRYVSMREYAAIQQETLHSMAAKKCEEIADRKKCKVKRFYYKVKKGKPDTYEVICSSTVEKFYEYWKTNGGIKDKDGYCIDTLSIPVDDFIVAGSRKIIDDAKIKENNQNASVGCFLTCKKYGDVNQCKWKNKYASYDVNTDTCHCDKESQEQAWKDNVWAPQGKCLYHKVHVSHENGYHLGSDIADLCDASGKCSQNFTDIHCTKYCTERFGVKCNGVFNRTENWGGDCICGAGSEEEFLAQQSLRIGRLYSGQPLNILEKNDEIIEKYKDMNEGMSVAKPIVEKYIRQRKSLGEGSSDTIKCKDEILRRDWADYMVCQSLTQNKVYLFKFKALHDGLSREVCDIPEKERYSYESCVTAFKWIKVGMAEAKVLAQEYARIYDGKEIECENDFKTRGMDDYILCKTNSKTGVNSYYEFQFNSAAIGRDATKNVLDAICEILHGGDHVLYAEAANTKSINSNVPKYDNAFCARPKSSCEQMTPSLNALQKGAYAQRGVYSKTVSVGITNTVDAPGCWMHLKGIGGGGNPDVQLRNDFGGGMADCKVLLNLDHSQFQNDNDLEDYLKMYMDIKYGVKITCDAYVKPVGYENVKTCYDENGKRIDFIADDMREPKGWKVESALDSMECVIAGQKMSIRLGKDIISTNTGTKCTSLDRAACTCLDNELRSKGHQGATWDFGKQACILNSVKNYKVLEKAESYTVGAVVVVGGAMVAILTGGTAIPVMVGAGLNMCVVAAVDEAQEFIEEKMEYEPIDKANAFLAEARRCVDSGKSDCAEDLINEYYHDLEAFVFDPKQSPDINVVEDVKDLLAQLMDRLQWCDFEVNEESPSFLIIGSTCNAQSNIKLNLDSGEVTGKKMAGVSMVWKIALVGVAVVSLFVGPRTAPVGGFWRILFKNGVLRVFTSTKNWKAAFNFVKNYRIWWFNGKASGFRIPVGDVDGLVARGKSTEQILNHVLGKKGFYVKVMEDATGGQFYTIFSNNLKAVENLNVFYSAGGRYITLSEALAMGRNASKGNKLAFVFKIDDVEKLAVNGADNAAKAKSVATLLEGEGLAVDKSSILYAFDAGIFAEGYGFSLTSEGLNELAKWVGLGKIPVGYAAGDLGYSFFGGKSDSEPDQNDDDTDNADKNGDDADNTDQNGGDNSDTGSSGNGATKNRSDRDTLESNKNAEVTPF